MIDPDRLRSAPSRDQPGQKADAPAAAALADSSRTVVERDENKPSPRETESGYRQLFEDRCNLTFIDERSTLRMLAVNAALRHYGYARETFLQLTVRDLNVVCEGRPARCASVVDIHRARTGGGRHA